MSDRKEAIRRLERLLRCGDGTYEFKVEINTDDQKAIQLAVDSMKADEAYQLEYEQPEFCEDCVSRKNILESLNGAFASTDWNKALFRKIVMDSPSVLPKATKNDLGVDCISREATVKRLCNLAEYMNEHKENSGDPYIMAALFIQDNKTEFPSVTPQEPRWIPTSERLPEEKDYSRCAENYDGAVYWCTDKGVIGIGWYYEDTKSWAWLDDTFPDHWGKVVAWMPLPTPYEPQESEDNE